MQNIKHFAIEKIVQHGHITYGCEVLAEIAMLVNVQCDVREMAAAPTALKFNATITELRTMADAINAALQKMTVMQKQLNKGEHPDAD